LEGVQIFANSLFSIQNNLEIIPVTGMILMHTCKKDKNWWQYVSLASSTSNMNFTLTWSSHTNSFKRQTFWVSFFFSVTNWRTHRNRTEKDWAEI